MLLPWILLAILNGLDVWTTYEVLERGGTEANPIAAWAIDNGVLVEGKILIVGLIGLFCLLDFLFGKKGKGRVKFIRGLWIVTVFYVFIVSWNFLHLI